MFTPQHQGVVDNSSGFDYSSVTYGSDDGFDSTGSSEYCGSHSELGSVSTKVNLPPGYECHPRATALKKEQEMLLGVDYKLKNWDQDCLCKLERNADHLAFAQTLDHQTTRFIDAVASVMSEMLKFADLFRDQKTTWGEKCSKKKSCTMCHHYMVFHPELNDLFAHQDLQNNYKTTLSINTSSLMGHAMLPFFLLALRKMVDINFLTQPMSKKMISTVTHVCLANESGYDLACKFLAYFNQLPFSVFSRMTLQQKEDGQIVCVAGENIAEMLNWTQSGPKKKDLLSKWERRPHCQSRKTFGLEYFNGQHCIFQRFPKHGTSHAASTEVKSWTKMTDVVSRVPVTDVLAWITHEMKNDRYFLADDMESPATQSIAYFDVYKFNNTYSVCDVEFDTICVDSRSDTVCVQLKDGFMVNLSPTRITFGEILDRAFEVQVNCKDCASVNECGVYEEDNFSCFDMETESASAVSLSDESSCESGDSTQEKLQQTFKAPAQMFKAPAEVPSFLPSNTEQYYQPSHFGMTPQLAPLPCSAQTVIQYTQSPVFQFNAYQVNMVQPPKNFKPSYV